MFDFRIHTFISGKRFQALGMRAIDSLHKISPNRVIFEKIFESKKHEKSPFLYTLYFCKLKIQSKTQHGNAVKFDGLLVHH